MTLEQAIEFCSHMSEEQYKSAHNTIIGDYPAYEAAPHSRLASEYKQLAEWLTDYKKLRSIVDACNILAVDAFAVEKLCKELKEAKRLLKLAVEDFAESLGAMYSCSYCKYERKKRETCAERETQYCKGICKWRYEAEALALIGEDGEQNG